MSKSMLALRRSIRVHPVLLLGVGMLSVSIGAFFAETLFASFAAVTGVSVVVGAVTWIIVSILTIVIGLIRSVGGN